MPFLLALLPGGIALAVLTVGAIHPMKTVGASTVTPATALTPTRVLVELFTSQGCSSCPPADDLLHTLGQQQGVVPLSYHVDYWDHLGWKDPFSKKAWSNRQRAYAKTLGSDTIYTPQLIIDGTVEEVGSDRSKVIDKLSVRLAQDAERTKVMVTAVRMESKRQPTVVARTRADVPTGAVLLLALYERHLATEIQRGENRNKTLDYDYLVRALEEAKPDRNVTFTVGEGWKPQDLGIVAFVQDPATGAVLGVGRASEPLALR